jgi:hypothetical protein
MITVDVNDLAEVHAAGIRVLNENLGVDIANVFLNLTRGGTGDWTKEKYDQPDMTDAELDNFIKAAKAETEARKAAGV